MALHSIKCICLGVQHDMCALLHVFTPLNTGMLSERPVIASATLCNEQINCNCSWRHDSNVNSEKIT